MWEHGENRIFVTVEGLGAALSDSRPCPTLVPTEMRASVPQSVPARKLSVRGVEYSGLMLTPYSHGCCDKSLPAWWLETTQMSSLRSAGQRAGVSFPELKVCSAEGFLLEAGGENPFPCLFQLLEVLVPGFVAPSFPSFLLFLHHTPFSSLRSSCLRAMRPCDDIDGPCA